MGVLRSRTAPITPTTAATRPQIMELTAMPRLPTSTVSRGTKSMVPKLEPMATTLMAWPCFLGNHMATRVPMPTKEPALRPPPTQHMAMRVHGHVHGVAGGDVAQARQDQAAGGHLTGADALVELAGHDGHQHADTPAMEFMFRMKLRSTPSRSATAGAMTLVPSAKKPPLLKKISKPKISRNQPQAPKPSFRLFHNFTFLLSGAAAPPPNRLKRVCLSFLSPSRVLPDVPAGMS